jgi:hypothetical protein
MATKDYLLGRKGLRGRPQAMLWADNPGTLIDGFYVPNGLEVGVDTTETSESILNQFIILSDDNRDPISMRPERIEQRQRMINGRMRSYHIADKMTINTSWTRLPSRGYSTVADFNESTGESPYKNLNDQEYTTDGGAGGVEILDWYNNHQGSFWVYLAYDNYKNFGDDSAAFNNLNKYNEIVEVFFADFQYSIERRGGTNYDFWNITLSLEEA